MSASTPQTTASPATSTLSPENQAYVKERIEHFEERLKETKDDAQRENIKAVLNIYKENKIPGGGKYTHVFFQNGKMIHVDDIDFDLPKLHEVCQTVL